MNNVSLVGRLTKDPELRQTAGGTDVCSFTLAVDRRFKSKDGDQPTADFIPIVLWKSTAAFAAKYFTKGMRIFCTGRIQTRNWESEDGTKKYVTEVVGDHVGFADGRREEQEQGQGNAKQEEELDDSLPF